MEPGERCALARQHLARRFLLHGGLRLNRQSRFSGEVDEERALPVPEKRAWVKEAPQRC
jgi:hypothetical protein